MYQHLVHRTSSQRQGMKKTNLNIANLTISTNICTSCQVCSRLQANAWKMAKADALLRMFTSQQNKSSLLCISYSKTADKVRSLEAWRHKKTFNRANTYHLFTNVHFFIQTPHAVACWSLQFSFAVVVTKCFWLLTNFTSTALKHLSSWKERKPTKKKTSVLKGKKKNGAPLCSSAV